MLANLHVNSHNIDGVNQIQGAVGAGNYYLALGPSVDLASDTSINLISSQPVTITSAALDVNGNDIQNVNIVTGNFITIDSSDDVNIISENGPISLTSNVGPINITPGSGQIVQINGDVDVQKFFIHRVQYCVDDQDAANKKYVDDAVYSQGLSSLIIGGAGLTWDYLTRTLTLLNPLPAITLANSALTTNALGVPQWTIFSTGSSTKLSMLCYNGVGFSGSQINT